jgi:hypothetical protein
LFVKPDDYAHSGEAVSTLLEALRRLGATEGAPPTKSLFESGSGAESALYGLLRDGLARLEREARRHAEFVDRLTTTPKAATEKGAGTRTAGRFRAINRRASRVSVATLSRPFRQNGEPAREGPTLTLRPGAFYLDPGEARVVIVEAELPGPGRYESSLDLSMDDAVALKLWIEIDVYS